MVLFASLMCLICGYAGFQNRFTRRCLSALLMALALLYGLGLFAILLQ